MYENISGIWRNFLFADKQKYLKMTDSIAIVLSGNLVFGYTDFYGFYLHTFGLMIADPVFEMCCEH
jgi:hypothetical protein